MTKNSRIALITSCLALLIFFSGCSVLFYSRTSPDLKKSEQQIQLPALTKYETENSTDNTDQSLNDTIEPLRIYYYNANTDSLEVEIKQGEADINDILDYMREPGLNKQLLSAITDKTKIISHEITGNVLIVDLDASFVNELDVLIAGAAIVNSFIDNMDGIEYVKLTIDGKAYLLDQNSESGLLSEFPLQLQEVRETGILPGKDKTLDANLYFADITNQFVLSTVREIPTGDVTRIITAIIEQIEKGPLENEIGYLRTAYTSLGLVNVEYVQGNSSGINLYFDNQWVEAVKQSPLLPIAIACSLTESVSAEWVKFNYQNEVGDMIDAPINNFSFEKKIKLNDLSIYKGRRVNIYYADTDFNDLKEEIRAIPREEENKAQAIINLEIIGPESEEYESVVPIWVTLNEIQVTTEGTYATVDLPSELLETDISGISDRLLIYSIVNSLTDTQNKTGINTVYFTQENVPIKQFGSMDIGEGLAWNPTIIK